MEETKADKIQEQVEQRLQEQQAKKEFKDIGRVSNLKKTKAALRFIDVSALSELERDEVEAFNMVKKDLVWIPIDVNAEKDKGVTAGAAYFKVELRRAAPAKPINSKQARLSFVSFLTRIQSDLSNCYNVEQLKELLESYRNLSIEDVCTYIIDSQFNTFPQEKKDEIISIVKSENRVAFIYGSKYIFEKLVEKYLNKRFSNVLFSPYNLLKEAKEKEPVNEEQAEQNSRLIKERREKFIASNAKQIDDYKAMTEAELKSAMVSKWKINPYNLSEYKKNIEKFREWVISYFEREKRIALDKFDKQITDSKPKDNDWSWADIKKEKKATKEQDTFQINSKEPLSYIKRTGGYAIEEISANEIVDKFGYKAVNYGNYVDDAWSKQHTKFYLQAMSDLGELMNFSIKKLNELGGLALVFGGKGRKGHLAAYFPQTKDINLTKANGDGSVAHEYAHYLDNVIVDKSEKKAEPYFASDSPRRLDNRLQEVFTEIVDFFTKGKEGVTPKMKVEFFAKESNIEPSIYTRSGFEKINFKETIEETISQYPLLLNYEVDNTLYDRQVRIIGHILHKFNVESYELDLKLRTSMFYQKSAYRFFKYCYKLYDEKGEKFNIAKGGAKRSAYWTSMVEMFARSFETVVYKKILDRGRRSDYLVSGINMDDINIEGFQNPYPSGAELQYLEGLYDKMIDFMKMAYDIPDFVPYLDKREDTYVEFDEKKVKVKKAVDTVKEENEETTTFVSDDKVVDVVTVDENKIDAPSETKEEEISKENILVSLEGARVAVEFLEGQQKQDMIDYIGGLETLIEII